MPRLFVALRPPETIRNQLLDLEDGVDGARWQDEEQLHLTLRFIGEVEGRQADDIALALGQLRHASFALRLSGVGTFANKGAVHTLWAGVTPADEVTALHRKVDAALVRAGLSPEARRFQPHITLARFSRSARPFLTDFVHAHAALRSEPFAIMEFDLYESRLGRHGSSYHLLAQWPLAPPPAPL